MWDIYGMYIVYGNVGIYSYGNDQGFKLIGICCNNIYIYIIILIIMKLPWHNR
jgi:hypothetical protein